MDNESIREALNIPNKDIDISIINETRSFPWLDNADFDKINKCFDDTDFKIVETQEKYKTSEKELKHAINKLSDKGYELHPVLLKDTAKQLGIEPENLIVALDTDRTKEELYNDLYPYYVEASILEMDEEIKKTVLLEAALEVALQSKQNSALVVNDSMAAHWVGLYVNVDEKKIHFIDSFAKEIKDYPRIQNGIDYVLEQAGTTGYVVEKLFDNPIQMDAVNCGRFAAMSLINIDQGMETKNFKLPNISQFQNLETAAQENSAILADKIHSNFFKTGDNDSDAAIKAKIDNNKEYWLEYKKNTLKNISNEVAVEATKLINRECIQSEGEVKKLLEAVDSFNKEGDQASLNIITETLDKYEIKIEDSKTINKLNKSLQNILGGKTKIHERDREEVLKLKEVFERNHSKKAYDQMKPILDKYKPKSFVDKIKRGFNKLVGRNR